MKLFALVALAAAALAAPKQELAARDARDSPEIPSIEDQDFISTVLDAHWYWRRIHCAQDLHWNETLAQMARDDIRTCTHSLEHMISANSLGTDYRLGSNLSGVGPSPSSRKDWIEMARVMVHGWHEEEMFYDYSKTESKNDREIMHFTQLVWRDSRQLGCAVTDCTDAKDASFPGRIYCYYDPIGNNVAEGFFKQNVWPPICADPSKAELEARFGF